MRHAAAGLVLTALAAGVAWATAGEVAATAAAAAGLLATGVETAAVLVLRPALRPPFDGILGRWSLGLLLRMGGVVAVGAAVLGWPARFPVLPTALAFVAVLLPLLFFEMHLVYSRLRTRR